MGETSAATLATGSSFRSIGELAERCGNYCWLEGRLFELAGSWASSPGAGEPEVRVFCREMSFRHAELAAQWADRLPVRAGVDAAALVVPPPGRAAEALELLRAESDPLARLGGLVEQFLPGLLAMYAVHLTRASRVAEAPVRAVLELAAFYGEQEVTAGPDLLRRSRPAVGGQVGGVGAASPFAALFEADTAVFPAAWAS